MYKINIRLLLKIFFSLGLILFLVFNLDLEKLALINLDFLLPYFLGLIITLASLLIMTYRWKLLISEFLDAAIDFFLLFKYYLIGSFFNIFLPGAIGGDVVRTQRLSRHHNIRLKSASIITVAERVAGVYGLLILLSSSFFFLTFPQSLKLDSFLPRFVYNIIPLFILLLIPLLKFFLARVNLLTSYTFLFKTIVVLLLAQFGDITIAFVLSQYFELDVPFTAFIFIMPLVYIATVLPISLGGLGVREGSFSGLMMLYGVESSIAILIALLMFLIKVGVGIIGYVVYLKEK